VNLRVSPRFKGVFDTVLTQILQAVTQLRGRSIRGQMAPLAGGVMKSTVVLIACLVAPVIAAAQQPRFDGRTLWRHVEALAADDMEGRGTGTPGLERAQAYVVDQLKKAGLAPAGSNGFFQPVTIEERRILDCNAALVRESRVEPLTLGEHAACTTFVGMPSKVEAPLVFVGYGLKVPEEGYDDFAGLELKGKIAVTLAGQPEGIDPSLAALYMAKRWDLYREAGLIGWIFIPTPSAPWQSLAASVMESRLHLPGELDNTHGQQIMMYFNPAHADKLFEGSGHTVSELIGLARKRQRLPRFGLPVTLRASARTVDAPVASANVVAKLEGSDPRLRNEHVVVSAHLDGQGIGKPVNGDRIYNSAFDNASGVAALLDIAAVLTREGTRPKRSLLFTFFTGHEKGLLGSKYFVAHPTVSAKSVVANVNIDIIHAIVPLKAVRVIGMDESDLGDAARRAAALQNIPAEAQIELATNALVSTSDQANFVFAGIPAVNLKVGFPGEMAALLEKFRQSPYHTPFDEPQQPVNLETLAKFEEVARALLVDVADNPRRPEWKGGSLFRRYAK
jgi:hypothetical protein